MNKLISMYIYDLFGAAKLKHTGQACCTKHVQYYTYTVGTQI